MNNPEAGWFGFARAAGAADKTARVRGVFDSVAANYDVMNDLMSMGLHRVWKRAFVRRVAPQTGERILDVAGGTGDIAFLMHQYRQRHPSPQPSPARGDGAAPSPHAGDGGGRGGSSSITVCDINPAMLARGQARAIDNGFLNAFTWVEGNAEALPFKPRTFDALTIAFGLRNVARIDDALGEFARVLKPGGRFLCLEFAPVDAPVLRELYDAYSFTLLPWLGAKVAGDAASYQYLAESIRQFPAPAALARRMERAGFAGVSHTALAGGIVQIHEGVRV